MSVFAACEQSVVQVGVGAVSKTGRYLIVR